VPVYIESLRIHRPRHSDRAVIGTIHFGTVPRKGLVTKNKKTRVSLSAGSRVLPSDPV